jgi:hypothetical protein
MTEEGLGREEVSFSGSDYQIIEQYFLSLRYSSQKEAAKFAFSNGETRNSAPATKGLCRVGNPEGYEVGVHWNVKNKKGDYLGSVGQCNCCLENNGNPISTKKGAILIPERH